MQQPTMDAQRDATLATCCPLRLAVSTSQSSLPFFFPRSGHKTHLPPPDKTLKYVKNLILILRRHRSCHKHRNFSYNTMKFVGVSRRTNCMRIVFGFCGNEILIKLYYCCVVQLLYAIIIIIFIASGVSYKEFANFSIVVNSDRFLTTL